VVFRYPSRPEIKVLDRVNLEIPAGETVFLVGSSGSGKSTISNIILRMYDITAGVILIDGSPLPSLNTKWLRDNITVVEQQSVLFNTSIVDNIKLGRTSNPCGGRVQAITPEELKVAIDFALLAPVIESTDRGLDTMVGVGGARLSGGQRQRVALARARIRDTPILILDESVSALDARARARVMRAIRTWRAGRTTVIITHELSQIGDDDKYYMLVHGRVVEEGRGRDLQKSNGNGGVPTPFPSPGAPMSPVSPGSWQSINPFSDRYEVPEDAHQRRRSMPAFDNFASTELSKPSTAAVARANSLRNTTVRYSKFVRNSMLRPQSALFFVPPVAEPYRDDNEYDLASAIMKDVPELPPLPATPDIGVTINGQIQSMVLEIPHKRTVLPRPISSPPDYFTSHRFVFGCEEEFVDPGDERSQAKKKIQAIIGVSNAKDPEAMPSRYHKYISASEASNYKVSTVHILFMCYKRVRAKGLLWLGVILSVVNGGFTPLFSSVVARLITYMVTPVNSSGANQSSYPMLWIALALTLALVDGLTTYGRTIILGYVADQWVCDMRDRALRMVLQQDLAWHTQNRIETNDLASLIISQSEEIRTILTILLAVTVTTTSLSFICVIWVLVVSWRLCFVGIALASLYYFAAIFSKYVVIRWEGKCIHLNALLEEHIHETVSGIRTLRILGLERLFVRRFDAAAGNLRVAKIRDSFYSGIGFGLNGLISYIAQGILLWYGMKLIADEIYPSSKVLMVYSILFFSISSISTLLAALPQMHTTFTVCFRLFQILDFDPSLTREHSGEQIKARLTDGTIEFCDLYFSYLSADDDSTDSNNGADGVASEEEQDPTGTRRKITKVKTLFGPQLTNNKLVRVLDSFSATVLARKTTAIIGPSGSGKSTLVALLTKLYAPTGGRVLIDGMDLQTLDTNVVRQDIAVVGQMPLNFFDGTIYENIVFALPANNPQSLEAVRAVCRDCAIDEFISSLPEGYNTRIGGSTGPVSSGGTSLLSGGQMQRIGIARAIIRNPKILILDECTSGLDQVSTDAIKRTLRYLSGRMTVLIITHQENVAAIADFVIKVAEGRRVS
jgi:ATP-binding cassette subfamily B (MDR/TAP) protein 1